MANTFHAQIMTPEGTLFDGEVLGVKVPGAQGSFEVRYNHAPIISLLNSGEIRVRESAGKESTFTVSGGFVEMNNNRLTLLAEEAEATVPGDV